MIKQYLRRGILAVATLALLFTLISSGPIAQTEGPVTITILHTQEHHGQVEPARPFRGNDIGGVSARATLIQNIRRIVGSENVLLVDSGDILVGTPMSSVFRGEPDVLAYNAMGYDAAAVGNHEFDFEQKENRLQILMDLADYPLMAANVGGLDFEPDPGFITKTVGGLTVLLIGIANPVTPSISSPKAGTTFADPAETVRQVIAAEGSDADLIVAITHEDSFRDVALLQAVPDLDVVIGGHTFGFRGMVTRGAFASPDDVPDAIPDQPTVLENPDGVFVRAGEGPFRGRLGTSLGWLDLVVENGQVVAAYSRNVPVVPDTEFNQGNDVADRTPLDSGIEAILQPFVDQLGVRLNESIGTTTVDLDGARENVRSRETNLGNFIADVWRLTQGTDIGLQNGGGIRNSIPAGPISLGDVLSVQPFGNTVVTFSITGQQLLEAMENGVSKVEEGAGRFPQISGMTLTWDGSKEPGSRVVEITVGGEPLDVNKTYSVATNSFVGAGGDGYTVFREATDFLDTQFVDADVTADFIREAGTISPMVEGRITRVDATQTQ